MEFPTGIALRSVGMKTPTAAHDRSDETKLGLTSVCFAPGDGMRWLKEYAQIADDPSSDVADAVNHIPDPRGLGRPDDGFIERYYRRELSFHVHWEVGDVGWFRVRQQFCARFEVGAHRGNGSAASQVDGICCFESEDHDIQAAVLIDVRELHEIEKALVRRLPAVGRLDTLNKCIDVFGDHSLVRDGNLAWGTGRPAPSGALVIRGNWH